MAGKLRRADMDRLPHAGGAPRLGLCVGHVGKIVAIGLNCVWLARKGGREIPAQPHLFMKAKSSPSGPIDPTVSPKGPVHNDREVDLAVMTGKAARYIDDARATDHPAGYAFSNDASEKHCHLDRGRQGQDASHESFCPLDRQLVAGDEIDNVHNLDIRLEMNVNRCPNGSASDAVCTAAHSKAYADPFITLDPDDATITGTPADAGNGMPPGRKFPQAGRAVDLGVQGHNSIGRKG